MRKKRGIIFTVVTLIMTGISIAGCNSEEKKDEQTEIVWYLTNPEDYGVDGSECEPYQEVDSKRFERFNERLKELGISAKVVFKYVPESYEFSEMLIKDLVEKDKTADISGFSAKEYQQFLVLDDYFSLESMRKTKEALPKKIWDVNSINGKTYQIPRGNAAIYETVYCFNKPFLEEYQLTINEEEIRKMSPKEVIEWLLPYFEEEHVLDGKYYLTSAQDISYSMYTLDRQIPLLKNTNNNIILDLETRLVTDIFSNEHMSDYFDLCQWIYKNDIDGHKSAYSLSAFPVFSITSIPDIADLKNETKANDSRWVNVRLGNEHLVASVGNGVLKSSDNKELAVQVLAASFYDEELTNLMIYGIEDKDYVLRDGHAVYREERSLSCMGTFQSIGNNLIAYPNELEVMDKKEVTERLVEEVPIIPYSNFVPEWDKEMLEKVSELSEIYKETIKQVITTEITDMEAFLQEQQKKLKQAGVEEVISVLQRQVDCWED